MVLIHYKKTESDQFLFNIPANSPIDTVVAELVEANNLRLVIDKLSCFVEDLATHGPLKPEELRGLTDSELIKNAAETLPAHLKKYAEKPDVSPGFRFNEDKSGYRTGVILAEETTAMILSEVSKAKMYISKDMVGKKEAICLQGLKECISNLRGSVMIGYPGYHNLEPYEPAVEILEGKFEFSGRVNDAIDFFNPTETSIWWAGKEFLSGKQLSDYCGKNEKTKIVHLFVIQIVRMQKTGTGAPVREPAIDEETHKKMLSFYHKKQEEQKKLEEDSDDSFLNAPWANPNNLKSDLVRGGKPISWKLN